MGRVATIDRQNRLLLPEKIKGWFPPGTRFAITREGDRVVLRPVSGLEAHLAAVEAPGNDNEPSWEEIEAEIQAVRADLLEIQQIGPTRIVTVRPFLEMFPIAEAENE